MGFVEEGRDASGTILPIISGWEKRLIGLNSICIEHTRHCKMRDDLFVFCGYDNRQHFQNKTELVVAAYRVGI